VVRNYFYIHTATLAGMLDLLAGICFAGFFALFPENLPGFRIPWIGLGSASVCWLG